MSPRSHNRFINTTAGWRSSSMKLFKIQTAITRLLAAHRCYRAFHARRRCARARWRRARTLPAARAHRRALLRAAHIYACRAPCWRARCAPPPPRIAAALRAPHFAASLPHTCARARMRACARRACLRARARVRATFAPGALYRAAAHRAPRTRRRACLSFADRFAARARARCCLLLLPAFYAAVTPCAPVFSPPRTCLPPAVSSSWRAFLRARHMLLLHALRAAARMRCAARRALPVVVGHSPHHIVRARFAARRAARARIARARLDQDPLHASWRTHTPPQHIKLWHEPCCSHLGTLRQRPLGGGSVRPVT